MGRIALTIDVEDWFCVRNLQDRIPRDTWETCDDRLEIGLDFILNELADRHIRATFFVLGWVAERNPGAIRGIAAAGHEIASHGYSHRSIDEMTPDEFSDDVRHSREILSPLTHYPLRGYRAPSFSVTSKTLWALDILKAQGFSYDSSIYPTRHPNYGIPNFPRRVQQFHGLTEVPMTKELGLPISGGGYFRLYPYWATRALIAKAQRTQPVVMYFHPWEFDPDQPEVEGMGLTQRFRHRVGLEKNREKFRHLLDDFTFCTLGEIVDRFEASGQA
ncbi:MAG: DUF3473 domain-containing protein [Deltaproteobacteria bacterium]|nr:DUF3473 domain-containing protein [Deltaproteobacteria bacterium]